MPPTALRCAVGTLITSFTQLPKYQEPTLPKNTVSDLPTDHETESLRRFSLSREQVLERLWEFAAMGPEVTRGSISGQIKAISMIVAMERLIPDRRAASAEKNPAPQPNKAYTYPSAWRREQQEKTDGLQPSPDRAQEDQEEAGLGAPHAEPSWAEQKTR